MQLRVRRTTETGPDLYKLVIIPEGVDPGSKVTSDLTGIAQKHKLSPPGGCFMVQAIDQDGKTQNFLGGMYVAPPKYGAVSAELTTLGYKIEQAR